MNKIQLRDSAPRTLDTCLTVKMIQDLQDNISSDIIHYVSFVRPLKYVTINCKINSSGVIIE